jgi:hypothetical protein
VITNGLSFSTSILILNHGLAIEYPCLINSTISSAVLSCSPLSSNASSKNLDILIVEINPLNKTS